MKKPDITLAELLGVDQALSEVAMPPTPAPGSVGASTSMKVGSVGVPTPSTGASATFAVHADLHSHSTISDGSFTAEELLQQAADAHITHLAITNHDTTYGIDAIQRAAVHYPVRYIGGIEISAYDFKRNRKVHVLGLGVKEQSPAIKELCDPVLKRRSENTQWQQERLERCGYVLNTEVLHRLRKASTGFYKQHLMAALTSAPYTSSAYQQLYRKLFKGNGICHRDITYVDMGDAVRAITEDGGVAVLAHPGQLDSYDAVPELVDAGLWGIEKYHPDHTIDNWHHVDCLAQRYGLACTGGSDFHGAFGDVPKLGECWISL